MINNTISFSIPSTVTALNSCTKCVGSRGIIDGRTPDCQRRPLTSQLNVALIRMLRGSLMCLAYFVDMLFIGCFLQPGTDRWPVDWCRN